MQFFLTYVRFGGGQTQPDVIYIYIYTRRKDGAKAPSLLDHLELRFPTFDAKAMDPQRRSQMLKPWILKI